MWYRATVVGRSRHRNKHAGRSTLRVQLDDGHLYYVALSSADSVPSDVRVGSLAADSDADFGHSTSDNADDSRPVTRRITRRRTTRPVGGSLDEPGAGPAAADTNHPCLEDADGLANGTRVRARYHGRRTRHPGVINRVVDHMGEKRYDIKYDDGESERGLSRSDLVCEGEMSESEEENEEDARFHQEEDEEEEE